MRTLGNQILPIIIFFILFFSLSNKWFAIVWLILFLFITLLRIRGKLFGLLADYAQFNGKFMQSALLYQKALKADEYNYKVLSSYGYLLLKMGSTEESERIFDRLVNGHFPSSVKQTAKANLALVYWKTDRTAAAINLLSDIHKEGKATTLTYGSLTYLLIYDNRPEEALKYAREAYTYNPDDNVITENLARIHHLNQNMNEAASLYNRLEQLNPPYPEAWYNMGLFHSDLHNIQKAEELFNKALSLQFTFLTAISRLDVYNALQNLKGFTEPS